ncbi:MAG TPA: hypothetical protein PLJ26_05740 [Candidatus Omnitrophota bacterium]|nr:hypothetical protein [Candidatus Omnitrophota bacterium]
MYQRLMFCLVVCSVVLSVCLQAPAYAFNWGAFYDSPAGDAYHGGAGKGNPEASSSGSSGDNGWHPIAAVTEKGHASWNAAVHQIHQSLFTAPAVSANPITPSANPIMAYQTSQPPAGSAPTYGQYGWTYLNVAFKNGIPENAVSASVTVSDTAGKAMYTQPITGHVWVSGNTITIDQYAVFNNPKDKGINKVGAVTLTFYDTNGKEVLTSDPININPVGEGYGVRMGLPGHTDRAGYGPKGTSYEYGYAYSKKSSSANTSGTAPVVATQAGSTEASKATSQTPVGRKKAAYDWQDEEPRAPWDGWPKTCSSSAFPPDASVAAPATITWDAGRDRSKRQIYDWQDPQPELKGKDYLAPDTDGNRKLRRDIIRVKKQPIVHLADEY